MRISDKQRREVAKRLRALASHREADKDMVLDAIGLYMGECVDGFDPVSVNSLADLIDRETCRNVSAEQNRFECSECGFEMPIWDGDGGWMAFYFCPQCGAEVVE